MSVLLLSVFDGKFFFGELPLIAENPTVCDDIEMAGCPAVCSIDFWGSRGQCKTACPPIRFQISVPSVFEIPNFYFLQEKVNFYDLKIGKRDFERKSGRNWVKFCPFWMKKTPLKRQ